MHFDNEKLIAVSFQSIAESLRAYVYQSRCDLAWERRLSAIERIVKRMLTQQEQLQLGMDHLNSATTALGGKVTQWKTSIQDLIAQIAAGNVGALTTDQLNVIVGEMETAASSLTEMAVDPTNAVPIPPVAAPAEEPVPA